jgi:translation initiation factor IF-1
MNWIITSLFVVAALGFTGCASMHGTETVDMIETPDGAIIVDTFDTTATVLAVDGATRKVTLQTADGHKTKYQCSPDVVNFNQIQVGDTVKVEISEEAAVYLGQGDPPSAAAGSAAALAPVGSKPAGVVVNTVQATAEVIAVNAKKHKVTLKLSNGTTKTLKVGKKVNMAAIEPGQDVTVVLTEGLAIRVEK